VVRYLAALTFPRFVLWCYFIWWCGVALRYFDPSLRLWLSSLGIAGIIGTGLLLSTAYAGTTKVQLSRWVIARLYMMPFFVSSFAALIKDRGFFLVFHPTWVGNLAPLLGWLVLACVIQLARTVSLSSARRARA
jgi:hypothetical protein